VANLNKIPWQPEKKCSWQTHFLCSWQNVARVRGRPRADVATESLLCSWQPLFVLPRTLWRSATNTQTCLPPKKSNFCHRFDSASVATIVQTDTRRRPTNELTDVWSYDCKIRSNAVRCAFTCSKIAVPVFNLPHRDRRSQPRADLSNFAECCQYRAAHGVKRWFQTVK
jgi:hypothetical protein